jgi:2-phospho-L-lactate/phosphoenolpyruvate guanylyltransferase
VSVRIIVPHRGLAAAKTRLAPVLDDGEREALARRLLQQVLGIAREACGDVVVITPSEALEPLVAAAGARLVVQRGMGLNAGLAQARGEAILEGVTTLLILHGDLPNLRTDDVAALLDALPEAGGVAIAPDRAGTGTNGLALRPPDAIALRFGAESFAAHLAAAHDVGVPLSEVHRPGLAFDLDTPADLARWIELGDAA